MTTSPLCVAADALVAAACASMAARQVDEVPVVDADGALVGVLDVQDLLTPR
jgi:CBS domain-containing protein